MAVADYVRGITDKRPAALEFYQNVKAFGDPYGRGWLQWPYEVLANYRLVRNVYESMRGYVAAGNKAEWANRNDPAWQVVGRVLALEMERDDQPILSRYDYWLLWHYGVNTAG